MEKKRAVFKRVVSKHYASAPGKRTKDCLIAEEPFTVVWQSSDGHSERLSSTMRTPGDDPALAAGMLFAEGVIRGKRDVQTLSFCAGGGPNELNRLKAELRLSLAEVKERLGHRPSASLPQSACGLCAVDDLSSPDVLLKWASGRASISPIEPSRETLSRALGILNDCPLFAVTGASHATIIVDETGESLAWAEDVGRHNACDKAIGSLLLNQSSEIEFRLPTGGGILFSSRLSFELCQKAVAAGAAWIASVGAPTHLAVELAKTCGLPLFGFVSENRFNRYDD